jgi:serine/threonine protein phosphatase PrpC
MGIDPSEYSKNICYLVQKFAKEYEHHYNQDINQSNKYHDKPVVINESTVKNWIIKSVLKNKKKGSSTICVVYLDKISKMLFSSYIGDSSYMIARPQEIGKFSLVFKSEEQSHGFNIPYQVGTDGDKPYCAISQSHKIEKNDIVLLATDGLWDNVDSEDIIHLLNEFSKKENSIEIDINEFVISISSVAKTRSQDKQFISPFAKKALEYNRRYIGGKPDDITVVGAQIDFTGEDTLDDHHLSRTMDETCDSDLDTTRPKSDI